MKVLLISHNPICTNNNMGKTFLSLFSEFSREQLCQLYVHPSIPDVDVCHSYFQITDKQVLKSILWGVPGAIVSEKLIEEQIEKRKKGGVSPPKAWCGVSPEKNFFRDLLWSLSRWYSKKLSDWLDNEKPTCIFLAPGYSKFIYDIALKIAKERYLPILVYICDDYYFINPAKNILGKWQHTLLKKKNEEILQKAERLIVISEELKAVYYKHFGISTNVIMTGANISRSVVRDFKKPIRTLAYFGNLGAGRYLALADIGNAIDSMNRKYKMDIRLDIFSPTPDNEILHTFDGISCTSFHGFLSGKAYEDAFRNTDMLIHVESFEEQNKDLVKYSVSTKIADSLASGIPLFAYGPAEVSSIAYLCRNKCAITVTNPNVLSIVLEEAIFGDDQIRSVLKHATISASRYHNREKNSIKLRQILQEVVEE